MCEPELQYNGGQNSILHHVQVDLCTCFFFIFRTYLFILLYFDVHFLSKPTLLLKLSAESNTYICF